MELLSELEGIFVPMSCVGNYSARIWIGSTWTLFLLLIVAAGNVCISFLRAGIRTERPDGSVHGHVSTAIIAGLQDVLPLMLGSTFLLLPSTSTRVFRAFVATRSSMATVRCGVICSQI